jgi:hypothetical protein
MIFILILYRIVIHDYPFSMVYHLYIRMLMQKVCKEDGQSPFGLFFCSSVHQMSSLLHNIILYIIDVTYFTGLDEYINKINIKYRYS